MRRPDVLVAMAVLAASCGGGDDVKVTKPPTGPPVALSGPVNDHGRADVTSVPKAIVELEADDFYFAPTFVRANPSSTVTIGLHNEGSVQHTFTISLLGVDVVLDPDEERDVIATLPAQNVVRFFCRFHEARGMQGAFYWQEGGPVPAAPAGTG